MVSKTSYFAGMPSGVASLHYLDVMKSDIAQNQKVISLRPQLLRG